MKATELIALDDTELDEVAGGCLHGRHGEAWSGFLQKLADLDIELNINVDIDIINVVGNVIQAAGGSNVALDIEPG